MFRLRRTYLEAGADPHVTEGASPRLRALTHAVGAAQSSVPTRSQSGVALPIRVFCNSTGNNIWNSGFVIGHHLKGLHIKTETAAQGRETAQVTLDMRKWSVSFAIKTL